MMKLVRQPTNSMLCGQACVAMISGRTLRQVLTELVPNKERGTSAEDVRAGLRKAGYRMSRYRRPSARQVLPLKECDNWLARVTLLCRYTHLDGKRHWIIWNGPQSRIFDPEGGEIEVWHRRRFWTTMAVSPHEDCGRITSYYEIEKACGL